MAVETEEDVVLSTNTELIELVNRFPIDPEKVRMTESIIATIEGEDLSESEDSPIVKSISHKSALEHVNSLLLYITQDCDVSFKLILSSYLI